MLRAKQISQLSQCARSFYISGPIRGTADGSQSSSEDDRTSSKRHPNSSDALINQQMPHVLSTPASSTGSSCFRNAIGSTIQLTSKTSSCAVNAKVNSNLDVIRTSNKDLALPSKATDDRFPATGRMIAVKQTLPDNHNCLVDSRQPAPLPKSSYERPRSRANYTKVQTNSFSSTESGSSSVPVVHSDSIGGSENSNSMRAKKNKAQSKAHALNTHGYRQRAPEGEENGVAHKFSQPLKSSRLQAHSTRLPMNSLFTIEQYHQVLQQQKWGSSAEVRLNNLEHKLDAFQANQVLKLVRDHSIALGFFRWLKRQPGFQHDEYTYTTMIGILGQAKEFCAMIDLLGEMVDDGHRPTVVTYNRMIHAYGRANFIGEAVKVFHEMQQLGYEPDLVTYCTLIDIHAKAGFLDLALGLYQRMKAAGLSPDTFTYSVMVNCLGKGGRLAAAHDMYVEMIQNGCVPNLVTYNIMIALESKSRNYHTAVKLYRDMQAAGFRPDQVTYSIVMEALAHCGHTEEAEAVFAEMRRYCIPDEPLYGILVDMWGKAGNVERSRAWYRAMIDGGLKPNIPTCNSLLSAYLRAHRLFEARGLLMDMLWMGLAPSSQTYTLLLSCSTESSSEMVVCSELMSITGHPAHSFLSSLPDSEPSGDNVRGHTGRFLDLMHSEDRESKRGLADAVVDFLHKSGLKEEAGLVWEVAAERNLYPDSLREKSESHWLINLHVMSEGTAITALSRTLAWFRRRILGAGIGPRRIDIITGWGRRSRVTGSSQVRQAVEELLHLFGFPFAASSNSGCFVGCGEPLNQWLINSYVERMHLL